MRSVLIAIRASKSALLFAASIIAARGKQCAS
jgi:hypothetical protein